MSDVHQNLSCKMCMAAGAEPFTSDLSGMLEHTKLMHSAAALTSGRLICCVPGCHVGKKRFKEWKYHVDACLSSVGFPVGGDVFECFCGTRVFGSEGLLNHIHGHLRKGQAIVCPFQDCILRFSGRQAFYRHRTSVHAAQQPVRVCTAHPAVCDEDIGGDLHETTMAERSDIGDDTRIQGGVSFDDDDRMDVEIPVPLCEQPDIVPPWYVPLKSDMETRQVLLHLAMNSSFKVPKRQIRPAFHQLDTFCSEWVREVQPALFEEVLRKYEVDPGLLPRMAHDLAEAAADKPPFAAFYDESRRTVTSDYRITQFLKQSMRYVHPDDLAQAMTTSSGYSPLQKGEGVFVDLARNLTFFANNDQVSAILMDSFRRQMTQGASTEYNSYLDGSNCRKIRQASDEGVYIDIALYADEAEPMNPIGKLAFVPFSD